MAIDNLRSKMPAFAALAATLAIAAAARAMPAYQDALFARYPNAALSLQGCVACHDGGPGGPLNVFGYAFLANAYTLNAALDSLDSDNDGATNGAELGASPATAPGDARSKPGAGSPPPPSPPAVPIAVDGPALYANNCATCHGALASSAKAGATLTRMQGAISGNVGGMGFLSALSVAQLQAIESALAPAAAGSVSNYTGNWWNPGESGWGVYVSHQGDVAFATLFTYDGNGRPMWAMMSGRLQADGRTYAGDLQQVTGPPFNAQPFTPITGTDVFKVGTMSLTFSSPSSATLSYALQGVTVTKDIVPLVFGTAAASCSVTSGSRVALTNYQDIWWNPAESGWGVNITHQNSTLFATLMTYDAAGNNLWLFMSAGLQQSDGSYLGDLYRATGPAFNAQPFTPISGANLSKVGTMRFAFTDGMTGTLAYTVNGIPVQKSITRLVFASPVPACSSPVQAQAIQPMDGPSLYANHCAACHGALAGSAKAGATLTRMQAAIGGNIGGMGYLSALSNAQLLAIESALASVTPGPAAACGSCHSIPPSTGRHDKHKSRSCSTCHGAGYSSTTVNTATHGNGNKEVVASTGWDAAARTCANSCHGKKRW